MISQSLEQNTQMLLMITPTPWVYKNVIDKDNDERINIRPEHARHPVHIGNKWISQPKKPLLELIMVITGPQYNLREFIALTLTGGNQTSNQY